MKRLLFLFIFASTFSFAQEIEDLQEGYFFSETSKNFFRVDIKKPYDYYKVTSCSDNSQFIRAQFEGGDAAFNRELFRYISAYVDKEIYVVNGTFFLHMDIDKDGKVTNLDVTPKVENSEGFLRDLKFAVKKIKKNWTPSKCDNVPVDSRIRIKLNFVTESVDI
ncbi:hypothetical protein Q73A0000_13125 [Kaistella flava (ex Peng et al. 2021)]|uniref:TonB C-terminal domain-containing protein n=1 Tax=Kaistella flava (ex Peng et al. 2021) TaxID=2038776 RepID=A0A7M2YCX5_9FLAO|nr:hypothetical protein [Kaistella flava (ex Peng et al. 2021)]QOW11233.1 hypothetical protein Q73A0000_13125 [Kaistella flava (ex Peng et al. 2021)]